MVAELPGWVIGDEQSVRREAAPYREMSMEERGRDLARVCRAAARLLRSRVDRQRALAHVDPLPDSTLRALARLRQQVADRRRRRIEDDG